MRKLAEVAAIDLDFFQARAQVRDDARPRNRRSSTSSGPSRRSRSGKFVKRGLGVVEVPALRLNEASHVERALRASIRWR